MSSSPRLLGGRYEVGDLIGRGGMAEVHVGYDTRLGRQVAIKMLRWDLARDTSFLARFRREAQSAAGLNNPAIVAVYDSGEEQTRESGGAPVSIPYIVMEYVEGQTLRDLLKERGHLDPDEAARITASVLSALAYSHDKGIVHRDIKPANVMVTPTGAVKVMDFGIARALADTAATMTQSEAVIGTARYLSPEQAQGTTVDARSDLYSTGCMFYELLTGRTPFVGEPVSLVYQHIGEQPLPPSAYQPDVPAALDAVALHALVKDRAHRYQRASEFRADLQAARSGRVISAAARHTAASMAGVGAAGAAGAGAAAGLAGRYGDASETQRLGSDTRTERFDRNEAGAAGAGAAAGAAAGGRPAVPGDDDPHHTAPIPMNVPEKRRRWPWVFLVLLLVAALGVLGYGADRWIVGNQVGSGPYPKVIGMTQREAVDSIHSRGWPVPKIQHQANAAEKGQVFDQDPQPGTELGKDERGTIFVSNGPQTATVPPLVGSDLSSARTTLKNAGLKVGQISHQDSASASKDTVLQTDPGSGEELHVGSPVNLVVATGKNRVPDVVGDDMSTAIQKITDAGFHYDPHFVESTRTPNTVIDQQHAGARVGIGSTIQLTIAKSPPETKTITETQSPTSSPSPTSSEPSPSSTEPSPSSSEPSPTSTTTGPPGSSHTPPGKGGPHGGPPPMQ